MTVLNYNTDPIPEDGVWIMRPSIFGNPFRIGRDGTRKEVLAKYRSHLRHRLAYDVQFREKVKALAGKTLICCCKPEACHGDDLETAANWLVKQDRPSSTP